MNKLEVYTDGSASTANRPGGWAYVICINETKYSECSGHMENASNNDAEIEGAIQGLAAALKFINDKTSLIVNSPEKFWNVILVSDSQLVLGWADGTYKFKQVNKIDKYNQLKFLVNRLNVKTRWVKGHSGDEHNERCDRLANEARIGVNRKKDRENAIALGKTLIGTKKAGTLCVWYKEKLKIIDLETNTIEDYNRSLHGPRGGILEIREEKSR